MAPVYDAAVARHYAAYRPPLHAPLLERVLGSDRFGSGLDVGCGTGASTHALAAYCERVTGTDTSPEMVALAKPGPSICYETSVGTVLPVSDGSVDIITLAGVLPYLDRAALEAEFRRISQKGAPIIVYDFRVDMTELKRTMGLPLRPASGTDPYDHSASLEGLVGIETVLKDRMVLSVPVGAEEASHLLLASAERARVLAERYGSHDPFFAVSDALHSALPSGSLTAQCWVAVHRLAQA